MFLIEGLNEEDKAAKALVDQAVAAVMSNLRETEGAPSEQEVRKEINSAVRDAMREEDVLEYLKKHPEIQKKVEKSGDSGLKKAWDGFCKVAKGAAVTGVLAACAGIALVWANTGWMSPKEIGDTITRAQETVEYANAHKEEVMDTVRSVKKTADTANSIVDKTKETGGRIKQSAKDAGAKVKGGFKKVKEMFNEGEEDGLNLPKVVDAVVGQVKGILSEAEGSPTEAEMRKQIMEFLGRLQTKEDLERFIENNKAEMEGIRKESAGSKAKRILCRIWDVLCKVVKSVDFVIGHVKHLAVLALIVYACVTFKCGPIQLLKYGWDTACLIVNAAKITVDTTKKATDAYAAVQDASSDLGWKIGEIWANGADKVEKAGSWVGNLFKGKPKKRTYRESFESLYYGFGKFLAESEEA